MPRIALSVLLAAALAACATSGRPAGTSCPGDTAPSAAVQMLFGRAAGTQGEVSESDWRDFVATTVTPRFPEGLTVLDGDGQFRDATGAIIRERAKVLLIVVPDAAAAMPRIDAIAAAYKARFRQESVGVAITAACARF